MHRSVKIIILHWGIITAGIDIGNHRVESIQKESDKEGDDEVNKRWEVETHPDAKSDLREGATERYLALVDDVSTAWA